MKRAIQAAAGWIALSCAATGIRVVFYDANGELKPFLRVLKRGGRGFCSQKAL